MAVRRELAPMTFELILSGGTVVDGSGGEPFAADVGIRAGRIEAVGNLAAADAGERLDVAGAFVAPGFIDVHTHSDLAPFLDEAHSDLRLASLRQGVTTEICGNCGFSVFPAAGERQADVLRYLRAVLGADAQAFSSLEDYRVALDAQTLVTNIGTLVGHGTLRAGVLGFAARPPDRSELREMQRSLDHACSDGALGFSSGLIYTPGSYAATDELIDLARTAAEHSVPYVSHIRNEMDHVDSAIEEALRIGAESGASVQISHLKAAGERNWGRTVETLERLERARDEGVDVTVDVYPYTAGSTTLSALLPPWVSEGGIDALLARLGSARERARIVADFDDGVEGWQQLVSPGRWDVVRVASAPHDPSLEGLTIARIAADRGVEELDLVADMLVAAEGNVTVIISIMDEADVARVLASPFSMIGSDGIPQPGKPHPRWAGSFVRILSHYVRDEGLLTLQTAVRKMTSMPAQRFGLAGRGLVAEGMGADLVVFVLDELEDRATYSDPLREPRGVRHTLVDGMFGVRDSVATETRAGHFLAKGG